jgi:uncharacterized membrane protein
MDATTNWAAATAAGMITFTFSTADTPHYVLLLTFAFQMVFLLMESRRYQTFDLWRHRFRTPIRCMIVPALEDRPFDERVARELRALAVDMGRTVPHLGLVEAVGYRTRRNYGYLFGVTLVAWLMKLEIQPEPALTVGVFLERAAIAFVPGVVVFGIVVLWLGVLVLAAAAGADGRHAELGVVGPAVAALEPPCPQGRRSVGAQLGLTSRNGGSR